MASRHVRQVAQHPQRVHIAQAVGSPFAVLKPAGADASLLHRADEILRRTEHIVAAEDDATRDGVHRRGSEPAVNNRLLRRGNRHHRLTAHHLEGLADRLLQVLFELAKVVDLACKLPALAAVGHLAVESRQIHQRLNPATPADKGRPERTEVVPQRRDDPQASNHNATMGSSRHSNIQRYSAAAWRKPPLSEPGRPGPGEHQCSPAPVQPAGSKRNAHVRTNRQNTPLAPSRLGRWRPAARPR